MDLLNFELFKNFSYGTGTLAFDIEEVPFAKLLEGILLIIQALRVMLPWRQDVLAAICGNEKFSD